MAAFNCADCPKHNKLDEGGCPLWWEQTWVQRDPTQPPESEAGLVKRTVEKKDCGAIMIQEMLLVAVNTMEVPVTTMSLARNEINERLSGLEVRFEEVQGQMLKGLLSVAQSFDNRNTEVLQTLLAGAQQRVMALEQERDQRRLRDGSKV